MDIDMFMAQHKNAWDRLRTLCRRKRALNGAETDELIRLYHETSTHLSIVRSSFPDPALISTLSSLVAQGRSAIAGTRSPAWREIVLFITHRFPAAMYQSWRWWVPTAGITLLVVGILSAWIAGNPDVQSSLASPEEITAMTQPGGDYEAYYSSQPAEAFATKVWTNNAWVAAVCLFFGVLLGIPVIWALWQNALNIAVGIGLMFSADRGALFLGLLLPHGLLELTAVFVAAGTGLRLGWTVISPGRRSRAAALAREGRTVGAIAIGLIGVLLISGVIEAYVTPSGLPTWARIGIGVIVELAFLAYVFVLGRRAVRHGITGDIDNTVAGDVRAEAG